MICKTEPVSMSCIPIELKQEILIRPLCGEPFVMKGSYQILANSLKVGWHKDFINRLSYLLCGEDL